MPLHKGHIELVRFASEKVDKLIVLICAHEAEPIPAKAREQWAREIFNDAKIEIHLMEYDNSILPDTSDSSRDVSRLWADYLRKHFPQINVFFSSEKYGDYVAEFMNVTHIPFNASRNIVPVSGSEIRNNPFKFWDYIPYQVQPYFVKKFCILGTESTGKSIIAEKLAKHFDTIHVTEVARNIVSHTEEVTAKDLSRIAQQHALAILKNIENANKLLFIDTDLNITKSYSKFLFNEPLLVENWIEDANAAHLYLYLDSDCAYVQDGTRLSEKRRQILDGFHRQQLKEANISFHIINGNWEDRLRKAITLINKTYFDD